MDVPDRSVEVRAICERHPEAFPQTDQNDVARLILLRAVIIPTLNQIDGGQWGYLTKTDQRLPAGGYKVPCDVLVWRPNGVTVDCMTGNGACWIVQGVAPPQWQWTAVATIGEPAVDNDRSVPVYYAAATMRLAVGTIVPQPDGAVVLINAAGRVVSPQPDGRLELRDTVGSWERGIPVGPTVLRYDGTGSTWFVLVQPRA